MPTYYPPVSFYFNVEFSGVAGMNVHAEQCFQEVSGLTFEIETEELKAGGENRFSYKFPKKIKYPNLVLKRGLLTDTALINWFKSAMNTYFTVALTEFIPSDLFITLLDEDKQGLAIWKIVQAYPLKWSISDFRATENAIAVETIELAYQYFERIK